MTTSDCQGRSDRMVAVAQGEAVWSAEDSAHLATCADCGLEWRLVQVTAGLGRQVDTLLDPDRVAAGALAAIRDEPGRPARILALRRWRWLTVPLAAAAAIALVVLPGLRHGTEPAPALMGFELLPEMRSLDADQLQSVLELLPAQATSVPDLRSLDDMTEDELTNLLGSLEG